MKTLFTNGNERGELIRETIFLPRIYLNARQLCDLELLLDGSFLPLTGFLNEEEYGMVIDHMRLKSGALWPIPVVLDVPDVSTYKSGMSVALCDQYGKPVAKFTINSVYHPDKKQEAKLVYGTTDTDHYGVAYLFNETGSYYLGGTLTEISRVDRFDFAQYRHTPRELRAFFDKHNQKTVIGFQTRNPIHKVHFAMMQQAAHEYHGHILFHPSVGVTKDGDIDYVTRVRSYIQVYSHHMRQFATLSLLPLAMRMAGPKEALWHAIIRKNYGCTHFIVGRDHAGPGADRLGKPYYGQYDAIELAGHFARELDMTIIPFKEMVYRADKKIYEQIQYIPKGTKVKKITGTGLRKLIRSKSRVPDWISFPEAVREIRMGFHRDIKDGLTIFLTGLPSAGKSTVARMLYSQLIEIQDKRVTILDGDVVRQNLSKGLGFSKEDRDTNIKRIGFVASEITKHRGIVICAAVAPYEGARCANRRLITTNGTYVEVYVATPLSVCRKRDVKGLYKRQELGEITGVTGVDDPYEKPKHPEITINTAHDSAAASTRKIIKYLLARGLIEKNDS